MFKIIQEIYPTYNVKFNYRGFKWLKTNTGRLQEIDIWVPELKLAVEYDGQQHFNSIEIFGGDERLKYNQELDQNKNEKVKQHPEDVKYFVRFNYMDAITKELVINRFKEIGVSDV